MKKGYLIGPAIESSAYSAAGSAKLPRPSDISLNVPVIFFSAKIKSSF